MTGGYDPDPAYDLSLDDYLPVLLPGETSGHPDKPTLPAVNVDEAAQVDSLVVHNEDSPAHEQVNVTATRITGLGMAPDMVVAGRRFDGGITYLDLEVLEVRLGYGRDDVVVDTTHDGTTAIYAGAGDDDVQLRTVDGHTVVYGQAGDDTVHLGRAVPGGQTVEDIAALVAVDGGAGYDTINVVDSADSNGDLAWLTTTSLTGMDMVARSGIDRLYRLRIRAGATTITFVLQGVGFVDVPVAGDDLAGRIAAALHGLLHPAYGPTNPADRTNSNYLPSGNCSTDPTLIAPARRACSSGRSATTT